MYHVLESKQFSKRDLQKLFEDSEKIIKNPESYSNALKGKVIGTLFFEASTRTRLSFSSAVVKLGASLIGFENGKESSSLAKGESLKDTIKTVECYTDAIIIRHSSNTSAKEASEISKVPIICAGAGTAEHPTQSLLDVYTIYKHKKSLDNLKIAIIGDLKYGRTANSLAKMLSIYENLTVYVLANKQFEFKEEDINYLKNKNVKVHICESFSDLPKDIDVLYQTRTQNERVVGEIKEYKKHIINKELMKSFGEGTLIMHPLPRNEEIDVDVDDDERAVYYEQMQNGLYIRMALLLKVFGVDI